MSALRFRHNLPWRCSCPKSKKLFSVQTGSSFDLSPTDLLSLHQLKADVKEMEAASVVWTCNQWSVPVVVLKSITDFVEHEEGAEEFSMNLYGKALQSLCAVMPSVVRVVVEEFR